MLESFEENLTKDIVIVNNIRILKNLIKNKDTTKK